MAITIKDVAKKAEVSPSTVSRVIHKNPRISGKTVEKVQKAMADLKYHPNAAARSLARGRTHTLGLIIPSSEDELFVHPFFIGAMRGLSIEAQRRGYNIMYYFSSNQDEEVAFIKRAIRMNLVDGIILTISREEDECMEYLEENDIPYVLIGRPGAKYQKALWVDSDNFQAMYNLVNYFLNQGKQKIAFIGGSPDFMVTKDRLRGYREALRTHGMSQNDDLIFLGDSTLEERGYDLMEKKVSNANPDAIVASDDSLALGALEYMKENEGYIPIAGFNNTMKAKIVTPNLTSIDIMPEQLGLKAAERLIDALENNDSDQNKNRYFIVETQLILRESTNPEFILKSNERFL